MFKSVGFLNRIEKTLTIKEKIDKVCHHRHNKRNSLRNMEENTSDGGRGRSQHILTRPHAQSAGH